MLGLIRADGQTTNFNERARRAIFSFHFPSFIVVCVYSTVQVPVLYLTSGEQSGKDPNILKVYSRESCVRTWILNLTPSC